MLNPKGDADIMATKVGRSGFKGQTMESAYVFAGPAMIILAILNQWDSCTFKSIKVAVCDAHHV